MNTTDKQALISLISGLDLSALEVVFDKRVRSKSDSSINTNYNLMLTEMVTLLIEHKETDVSCSFVMDVIGLRGMKVSRVVLADTDFSKEFVRRIDGLIAALPIYDEQ